MAQLEAAYNVSAFSQSEFLAYFINAYNVLAVKTILSHPCQRDVFGDCTSLPGIRLASQLFDGAIWSKEAGVLNGRNVSLDEVESILRAPRGHGFAFDEDPRIHSAIVCASISCPNLHTAAFQPASVDAQLNATMLDWMANPKKGFAFDNYTNTVMLSAIFDFFPDDFHPTPFAFALAYVNETLRAQVLNQTDGQQLVFFPYNWDLNGAQLPCAANRACFSDLDALITGLAALLTIALYVCCAVCKRKSRSGYQKV